MPITFFNECVTIAEKFIRTVCFVDDQPFFVEIEDPINEDIDHRLNADLITKAFASQGKSSTFYRYQKSEEESDIIKLINNSDVTVLDWKIVLNRRNATATTIQPDSEISEIDATSAIPKSELLEEAQTQKAELGSTDTKEEIVVDANLGNETESDTSTEEKKIEETKLETLDDEEDIPEDESRGRYAMMLIDKILKQNHNSPKLLLIYTAETDFEGIFRSIEKKLKELGIECQQNASDLCFQNDKIRISIFFKQPSSVNGKHLSEEVKRKKIEFSELPNIVNQEFAKINNGLLAGIVLKALTKIRNHTIDVLNTFTNIVDPAFLAHRSMLTHPPDSEEHLIDIIGSEIKSIIKDAEAGNYLSDDLLKKYIEQNFEDKDYDWKFEGRDKFNSATTSIQTSDINTEVIGQEPAESLNHSLDSTVPNTTPGETKTTLTEAMKISEKLPEKLSRESLIKFTEVGVEKIFIKWDTPMYQKVIFSDNCHKSLTNLFAKDDTEAEESNNLFAALTTIKSTYNKNKPILTLGTILNHNNEYWLCIQPKCDTVRITKSRGFLLALLNLVNKSNKFDIVLKHANTYKYFKIDYSIYKTKFVNFKANWNQTVRASVENNKLIIGTNPKMDWLGELKSDYAQSISNIFGSNLSRVGMDHSEWLRRSS